MLYHFFKDMLAILRFRYRSPETYLYSLPVVFAVLLLLGAINAASMSPLFGKSTAAVVFSVLLTIVKWLVLSRAMRKMVHYQHRIRLPLTGFTLVSEALAIPMLLILYIPQLAPVGMFYQVWIFWAQATGFMKIGKISGWKVMLGYILYGFGTLVVGSVLLMLFMQAGWLDADELNRQLQGMMTAPR